MANKKRQSPITAEMIVAARKRAGLSQAKAAQIAGLSLRILQQYEGGYVAMSTAAFAEFERLVNSSCVTH